MRYMVIVKASQDTENGVMPTEAELAEMGAYNEELVKAGVMLAGEGLHPSSKGARVRFDENGRSTVIDGPFAETKELVAGFWILEVSSREEVVEWVRKAPFRGGEVEIRQVSSAEDFGDAYTPELREQEDRLRATVEAQHGG
ncbi:YciI family protein [Blastococcus jejuensis]|uniref:YciI family protein n=1 Tax=Blastococcus jejuensis TaxID=351224 RepID=A0ABP6NWZ9_9ACTN